jgi:hypothetical protein
MADPHWIAPIYVSVNHSFITDSVPSDFYKKSSNPPAPFKSIDEDDNFNVCQTENLQHSTQNILETQSQTTAVVNVCYDTRQLWFPKDK